MAGYVGNIAICTWTTSTGTGTLSADFRTFNYSPSVDLVEETAGADANKLYLAAQKDGKFSWAGVQQAVTAGTALLALMNEGQIGTLFYSPEGTAATKPKYTIPAISMGWKQNEPYNNVVEITCEWQQNGARTEGTN